MSKLDGGNPEEPQPVSVLLVDDHDIWRGDVQSMLRNTEFVVVGEAASSREGVEMARQVKPHITLLDIRMAGEDGFEALAAMKAEIPEMAVVMLTAYDNPTFMARAMAGGASGYLLKSVKRAELLRALRAIIGGETLLKQEDFQRTLKFFGEEVNASSDLFQPLTQREMEVLRLLATGLTNRQIREVLFIGDGTVKTHVLHIIAKLGVSDRVQAAVWAARRSTVMPEVAPGPLDRR